MMRWLLAVVVALIGCAASRERVQQITVAPDYLLPAEQEAIRSQTAWLLSGSTALLRDWRIYVRPYPLTFSPPIRVEAGWLYYAAVAVSSTSGAAFRGNPSIQFCIITGMGEQTSALPLPATAAPVTVSSAYLPVIIFGVR